LIFFNPQVCIHPANNVEANLTKTPEHIAPEWYFLPYYTILRALPTKGLGIFALFSSIGVLFLIPVFDTVQVKSPTILHIFFCGIFLGTFLNLMSLGTKPMDAPYILLGRLYTF